MKNSLTSNLGLKLVSVLFAFALWMIVVNVDDPVITKKFKNIPVTILNENLIEEQGEIYEIIDNSNIVTATVKAKRSIVENLRIEDFLATADIAERISANSIPIHVTLLKHNEKIVDLYLDINTIKIEVEQKVEKEIPVVLELLGNVAEGFAIGEKLIHPKKVSVTGPESEVNLIEMMLLTMDVNGIDKDNTYTLKGTMCNADSEPVSIKKATTLTDQFEVTVKLLHTKSVDLDLPVQGEAAPGFAFTKMEYTPTTILLAGKEELLAKVNTLQVLDTELNITNAKENVTKSIDISKYIPEGLFLVNSEDRFVHVTLYIQTLALRSFTIPASSIDVSNPPSGMDYYFETNDILSFAVRGKEEELSGLSLDDIKITVDLKNKSEGIHYLDTTFTLPNGFYVTSSPTVKVTLRARTSDTTNQTQTPDENINPGQDIVNTQPIITESPTTEE